MKRTVAVVVQSGSARTVSWAARPLAVGSRPCSSKQKRRNTRPSGQAANEVTQSLRRKVSAKPRGEHHPSCCLGAAGLCWPRNFEHTWLRAEHLLRRPAHEWQQCLQQEQPAHSPHTERRHLTPPSSGRAKGRFAPFGPPLMSNVRSLNTEVHARRAVAGSKHRAGLDRSSETPARITANRKAASLRNAASR